MSDPLKGCENRAQSAGRVAAWLLAVDARSSLGGIGGVGAWHQRRQARVVGQMVALVPGTNATNKT